MKRCVRVALALVAFAWASPAFGQSLTTFEREPQAQKTPAAPEAFPEGSRLGYVDLDKVAALTDQGRSAAMKLRDLQTKKAAEAAERSKTMESLRQKLSEGRSVLDQTAIARLQREFQRAQVDFQRFNEDAQAEVQDTQQELLRAFTSRLFSVVEQVATERKLWAVFSNESNLLWHLPAIDLSQEVASRLDDLTPTK